VPQPTLRMPRCLRLSCKLGSGRETAVRRGKSTAPKALNSNCLQLKIRGACGEANDLTGLFQRNRLSCRTPDCQPRLLFAANCRTFVRFCRQIISTVRRKSFRIKRFLARPLSRWNSSTMLRHRLVIPANHRPHDLSVLYAEEFTPYSTNQELHGLKVLEVENQYVV
jgi:hypothetical protein